MNVWTHDWKTMDDISPATMWDGDGNLVLDPVTRCNVHTGLCMIQARDKDDELLWEEGGTIEIYMQHKPPLRLHVGDCASVYQRRKHHKSRHQVLEEIAGLIGEQQCDPDVVATASAL